MRTKNEWPWMKRLSYGASTALLITMGAAGVVVGIMLCGMGIAMVGNAPLIVSIACVMLGLLCVALSIEWGWREVDPREAR